MDNQELIAAIKERFQRGQRRAEIRDALMQEGWQEQDIDDAIGIIQKDALKQLPGFSHFFSWFDNPQTKSKMSSPKMTAIILVGCSIFLIALVVILYFVFDPFNTKANQRDKQREADLGILRTAMGKYFQEHSTYPADLPSLSPDVLNAVPRDPSTGANYKYTVLDNGKNFELCISFETNSVPCVYATPLQTDIPIVPTATSVPDFVPQSASPSSSTSSL
jgi:hypothetical protein